MTRSRPTSKNHGRRLVSPVNMNAKSPQIHRTFASTLQNFNLPGIYNR